MLEGIRRSNALFVAVVVQLVASALTFQIAHRPTRILGPYSTTATGLFPLQVASIGDPSSSKTKNDFHDISTIREWTEDAIFQRGSPEGLEALRKLRKASEQRLPFDFESNTLSNIEPVRHLLPTEVTEEVSDIVKDMEADGSLSTNLDSVDGLPSFHLNLVSNGKPLFPKSKDTTHNAFGQNVQKLLDLVGPYIYNDLLPRVRQLGSSSSDQIIEVSDIFLRRYGQDSEDARHGISAHYDVFSKVTAVIAMDNVAAEGTNGLYTTAVSSQNNKTSNHASLRRYFPLKEGDGVIHTWEVLHGVDVEPGMDRTSLIVWFTEKSNSDISPWLIRDEQRLEKDDVTQFVLASALESAHQMSGSSNIEEEEEEEEDGSHEDSFVSQSDAAMYQSMSQLESTTFRTSLSSTCLSKPKIAYNSQEWYLKSASQENTFALSRIGGICEAEEWTDGTTQQQALELLSELRLSEQLPKPIQEAVLSECQSMAWRFWLEGAIRGNPSAQFSLADDLMLHAVHQEGQEQQHGSNTADARLLATVLFGLAAQQGAEDALDRLARIVEMEVQKSNIHTEKQFQQNPVVQTAQAAMASKR